MIEVNLLPGAKRGKRKAGGGSSINFAATFKAISEKVKDKFLAAAVGSFVVAGGIIAFLYTAQTARASSLAEAEKKAQEDSAHYASVLLDRTRAEARRDSALTQLNIIKAIDDDRFIWPHIMDEVSRAIPQYTWLRTVAFTGTAQGLNPPTAIKAAPAAAAAPPDTSKAGRAAAEKKRKAAAAMPAFPRDTVRFRLIGRTMDIQALTRFFRNLEESPFLGSVQLVKSETQLETGKEIYQFTLDVMFTHPDTTLLKRVPLTLTPK